VQDESHIPYHYYARTWILLLLVLLGGLRGFGQDSTRRAHLKDTVFPRVDSLKAAIVTATLRPRLKGDTMEYNTSNIRMRANATVEQLLGLLPGLQIDMNGNITYNGEKIQHLLVDGEDIFGDNPTLVTRNFDASKIARVQVLDRRSERALFTGVDDGTRTKTLNLVLKESAKDGYFGKIEAGGNTDGYYSANGVAAGFRNKEQFTALGLTTNTGVVGAGNAGGIGSHGTTTDPLNASAGAGIPNLSGIALHYANTWNEPNHLLANYQYSHYLTRPVTTTQTLQTQPGTLYRQDQQNQSTNEQDQHWANGVYDWAPGKVGTFKITFLGNRVNGENQFSSLGSSSFGDTLVNSNQRTIQDKIAQQLVAGTVSWRNAIGRPERVLSVVTIFNKASNTTSGHLLSIAKFYQSNGNIQNEDTTDQRKALSNQPLTLGANISYTEPVWKNTQLAFNYGLTANMDNPLQETFNRGDGKYQDLVDSLSSRLQTRTLTQFGSVNLQGKTRRLSYTAGADMLSYSYRQKDVFADSLLRQRHLNLAPRLLMTYTVNPVTSMRLYYTAITQQPSITQLQPVKNNSDPLHITLGNPNLRPAFTQSFHWDIQWVKTWLVILSVNSSLKSNGISTRVVTDSLGRQISQPVNVDGGGTAGLNLTVARKVLGFDMRLNTTGTYSRDNNYVNADLSRNENYSVGSGLNINRNVPDKYNLQMMMNFQFLDQRSSINPQASLHYWSQNHSGALTVYLLRNYEINCTVSHVWQQRTSELTKNMAITIWNSYVARNFLHDKLVIKAQWNNILNQNSGISRTNVNNVITESSTNILGRYWMLSAIYHFDKKFKR
jgi:hypothetical protein